MRKFYLSFAFLICSYAIIAQPLKFKVGMIPGPNTTSFDIVVSPNVNFTGYFTNVVFVFQIPVGVVQPTIIKSPLSTYFSTYSDLPTLPNQAGYVTYAFSASNSSITSTVNITAGTNYPILRLYFNAGPATPSAVRLAH